MDLSLAGGPVMKPGESGGAAGWPGCLGSIPSSLALGSEDLCSLGVSYSLGWIKFDQEWGMKPRQGSSDSTA